MNTPASTTPTPFSVVIGGEDVPVVYLSDDNKMVKVRVRAVPARHLFRVLQLADKEAELIEYVSYLPREGGGFDPVPPGWADNLSRESHVELFKAAERQNFSAAADWAERQIVAKKYVEGIMLKAEEAMQPLMERMLLSLEPLLKRLQSPASPSTPSSTDSPTAKS